MTLADLATYPFFAVRDLVADGGPFVLAIFACGVLFWTLLFERLFYLRYGLPRELRRVVERWMSRSERTSWCARQIRAAMVSQVAGAMRGNQSLLRVLVPLAPLLGLIGTVSGMLEVFDSMALRGSADARTMASGVSHAMICTMTGLAVSLGALYPVHYLEARATRTLERLDRELQV